VDRDSHSSEIRIDKDGQWHFGKAEMVRQDIVQYFYQHLKRDEQGCYLIEIEEDRCYIEVEDTPYVIRGVTFLDSSSIGMPHIELSISDGTKEILNINDYLRIGKGDVLYCPVKNGEHEARFSRPAYYQLCERIEYNEKDDRYLLKAGHGFYPLCITPVVCGEAGHNSETQKT